MAQFVLDEDDLSGIYSCISGEGSVVTSMMLLSKPEATQWSPGNVYDDCYLLTLSKDDLIELITHVSEESGAAEGFALIAGNLERGLLSREDEEEDEEDDDDEDEDAFAPGGHRSLLNADGSPRQVFTGDAYCVHCKVKRDFEGLVFTAESGRRMAKGNCPVCGTTVNRILVEE
jgi:hypothetical protein